MRLIKAEDVCDMLNVIADSKAITTKHGAIAVAITALDDIPAIDPESLRPQGAWVDSVSTQYDNYTGEYYDYIYYRCSKCHTGADEISPYCPNCGAKMTIKEGK